MMKISEVGTYSRFVDLKFLEAFQQKQGTGFLESVAELKKFFPLLKGGFDRFSEKAKTLNNTTMKIYYELYNEVPQIEPLQFRMKIRKINEYVSVILIGEEKREQLNLYRQRFLSIARQKQEEDFQSLHKLLRLYCLLYQKKQIDPYTEEYPLIKKALTSFKKLLVVRTKHVNSIKTNAVCRFIRDIIKVVKNKLSSQERQQIDLLLSRKWFGPKLWQSICKLKISQHTKLFIINNILNECQQRKNLIQFPQGGLEYLEETVNKIAESKNKSFPSEHSTSQAVNQVMLSDPYSDNENTMVWWNMQYFFMPICVFSEDHLN